MPSRSSSFRIVWLTAERVTPTRSARAAKALLLGDEGEHGERVEVHLHWLE
jgi:hypothetical protein